MPSREALDLLRQERLRMRKAMAAMRDEFDAAMQGVNEELDELRAEVRATRDAYNLLRALDGRPPVAQTAGPVLMN